MPRKHTRRRKLRKYKRGGQDPEDDIEMGPTPEKVEPYPVPADPKRHEEFEFERIQAAARPITPKQAEEEFSKPNPEERERAELKRMGDEDPYNRDPWDELEIFGSEEKMGGRRRRRRTKRRQRKSKRSRRTRKSRRKRY